jgi:glycosyltransferase involved in cell wall biosynthesis
MTRVLVPPAAAPVTPGEPPTISVVIPAYQAATVIGDALDSVLAQTRAPLEIIVCDDGSTDDLMGALAPYRGEITLVRQDNRGEAAAKNAGARAASGDLLAILDADDVFLPTRLEALSRLAADRPDLDLLTTDAYIVVNGTVVRRCFHDTFRFETGNQRHGILRTNFLPFVAVRREPFLAVGGFDEGLRKVPDWDCWLRMILSGSRAGLVDEPLAEYRLRATNVTSDRLRLHEGRLETLEKALDRNDLDEHERAIVLGGIAHERREVAVRRAATALLARAPDARALAIAAARCPGLALTGRVRALAAAAAPGVARRALASRARRGRELAGGLRARVDG